MRGKPGSEASAMVFGEFLPSPDGHPLTVEARMRMSPLAAFGAEVIGTAILLLVIFCTTDTRNAARPQIAGQVQAAPDVSFPSREFNLEVREPSGPPVDVAFAFDVAFTPGETKRPRPLLTSKFSVRGFVNP